MDLKKLFELQATLNKRVGLDDGAFQALFSNGEIVKPGSQTYNERLIEAGRWIDDMLKAMNSEIEELRDCTYWKHWCSEAQNGHRYKIKDLESARKEVIDILHFWISLAQIVGMSADMVGSMYEEKLAKNLKRQDDGYSIEVKDLAWELLQEHDYVNPDVTSLEDLPESDQAYWLDEAKKHISDAISGYSVEVKDLAWELLQEHDLGRAEVTSLKDLPECDQKYYLDWAKRSLIENLCDTCVTAENDCSMAVGKTHSCIRYHKKTDNPLAVICSKCRRNCGDVYVMTGEGPVCGSCV